MPAPAQPVPDHVPPELIGTFNLFTAPGMVPTEMGDPQAATSLLHSGPPIFFAPGNTRNGESGGVFMQRVCFAFEKLVEDMMRSGTTSAVVVAHGGTIMTILSMYGIPKAKFYDWMVESGCGYSIRITPGLWMRSMVAEVYATIPAKQEGTADHTVIDLAREAANRAYGKKDT